jgi:predicted nuclease of restriction endonuclease-like (RecB) superfamily
MNYYNEIKENLINNEIYKRVKDYSKNKSDLDTYYKVGKLLTEAGKQYGDGIIKEYSKRLTTDLNKKYDVSSLNKMKKFYNLIQKMATVSPKLLYSHYVELLSIKNIDKVFYYIKIVENNNLTVRELRNRIKSNEYERLPNKTKEEFIKKEKPTIQDLIPNPIIIINKNNTEVLNEKILHQLILENIESFMKKLGNYYSFIGSEYKIKIGNSFNYIDLLLYNIEFNCYVVIELKVTELKKEHIGQIQIYMNYIDTNLKKINQDKTILWNI